MHPDMDYQVILERHRDLRETSKWLQEHNQRDMFIMRMSVIIGLLLMVLWLA